MTMRARDIQLAFMHRKGRYRRHKVMPNGQGGDGKGN